MSDIKSTDVVRDADLLGEKADVSYEETMHFAALTEEEKIVEKQLKRRIDALIMPLVVLVYLMNYIDRYAYEPLLCNPSTYVRSRVFRASC